MLDQAVPSQLDQLCPFRRAQKSRANHADNRNPFERILQDIFAFSMSRGIVEKNFAPTITILARGDLTLLVSGPKASASLPMLDGTIPAPGGGWNRFLLDFNDLESVVAKLKANGAKFRNDILDCGGQKIICEDPFGNVIELT